MYNRYIPDGTSYTRVVEEESPGEREEARQKNSGGEGSPAEGPHEEKQEPPAQEQRPSSPQTQLGRSQPGPQNPLGKLPNLLMGKDSLASLFSGKERGGLSSLLKTLKLDEIDTGDILLLLIILYLLVEGDDLELVIALGLVLIMGLGDSAKEDEST